MKFFHLLLFFSLFIWTVSDDYVFKLAECNDMEKIVLIKNFRTSVTCTGLVRGHNIYWSVSEHEKESRIADCKLCDKKNGSCPNCSVSSLDFTASKTQNNSTLNFVQNMGYYSGKTLKCSSITNVTQTKCIIQVSQGYTMPHCHNGKLEILETKPSPIQCQGLQTDENMIWTIGDLQTEVAFCKVCSGDCGCNVSNNEFNVTRSSTVSQLMIKEDVRGKANKTLICIRRDGTRAHACRLRSIYPAVTDKVSVTLADWKIRGHADLLKVYDSEDNITCLWRVKPSDFELLTLVTRPSLNSYQDTNTRTTFYKGTCDIALNSSSSEGMYHISLEILPGAAEITVGNVTISRPGQLLLENTSCPPLVEEGHDLNCKCGHSSEDEGSPPATVFWTDQVSESAVLHVSTVRRNLSGNNYTCRSVWGPDWNRTEIQQIYTLHVTFSDQMALRESTQTGTVAAAVITTTVAVLVLVIVVIIVKKRRRNLSPRAIENSRKHATDDKDFEEYVNEFYEDSDIDNTVENNQTTRKPSATTDNNTDKLKVTETPTRSSNNLDVFEGGNSKETATYVNMTKPSTAPEMVDQNESKLSKSKKIPEQHSDSDTYAQVQKKTKEYNLAEVTEYANCPESAGDAVSADVYMNMSATSRVHSSDKEKNKAAEPSVEYHNF